MITPPKNFSFLNWSKPVDIAICALPLYHIFALREWDPSDKNAPLDENGEPLNWLNVGSGIDLSIKKLANMISEITSYKGEIYWDKSKPDGTFQKLLNVSRLNNLGWQSKISLSEGLNITYEDYKKELLKNQLRTK